jgi:hypothetical protein
MAPGRCNRKSRPAIRSSEPAFDARDPRRTLGFCLAVLLATACSFDEARLRKPNVEGRDATVVTSPAADVGAAGNDGRAEPFEAGSGAGGATGGDLGLAADLRGASDPPPAAEVNGPLEAGGNEPAPDAMPETSGSGGDRGGSGGSGAGGASGAGGTGGGAGGASGNGDADPDTDGTTQAGDADTGTASNDTRDGDDTTLVGDETGDGPGPELSVDLEAGDVASATETAEAGPEVASDDPGPPAADPDLVLWYRFDEASGTTAYDSAQFGGVARNATLATTGTGSTATFTTAAEVGTHALTLAPATGFSSGGGYVILPTLDTLAPQAITFAVWVNLATTSSSQNWERIFDFGDSTTAPTWFNLTARGGSTPYGPVFNISDTGHATADQQKLTGATALTANAWHHIAVVLPAGSPYTGVMYVDGAVAATNNAMTVHLADVGANLNTWMGRSQFTNDPYFAGSLDDFRVYRRALSPQEITDLMAIR